MKFGRILEEYGEVGEAWILVSLLELGQSGVSTSCLNASAVLSCPPTRRACVCSKDLILSLLSSLFLLFSFLSALISASYI